MISIPVCFIEKDQDEEFMRRMNDEVQKMKSLDDGDEEKALPELYSPLIKKIVALGIRIESDRVILIFTPEDILSDESFTKFIKHIAEKIIQDLIYH